MEDLFNCLCSSLMFNANKDLFLKGEGLQLMILMLRWAISLSLSFWMWNSPDNRTMQTTFVQAYFMVVACFILFYFALLTTAVLDKNKQTQKLNLWNYGIDWLFRKAKPLCKISLLVHISTVMIRWLHGSSSIVGLDCTRYDPRQF